MEVILEAEMIFVTKCRRFSDNLESRISCSMLTIANTTKHARTWIWEDMCTRIMVDGNPACILIDRIAEDTYCNLSKQRWRTLLQDSGRCCETQNSVNISGKCLLLSTFTAIPGNILLKLRPFLVSSSVDLEPATALNVIIAWPLSKPCTFYDDDIANDICLHQPMFLNPDWICYLASWCNIHETDLSPIR